MVFSISFSIFITICFFAYTCNGSCNQLDRDSLSFFNLSMSIAPPLNWSLSADCCTWEGVGCDDSGRVTSLWLPSRGLTGRISSSIANLTTLSRLSLSHNLLSGPLPDTFFASLHRLQVIDLSHNRLSGDISVLDKLPATIETFNLSSNQFNGTIQSSFLQAALNLESFDVSNNSFYGSIPSYICSFYPSTRVLDFSNNDFEGPISPGFGQCSKLTSLRAGFNVLSGDIPQDIYGLLTLQELYLPVNKLSGYIDGKIVNLVNLRILALYFPRDIGKLSKLEYLQLHINKLNDTIPTSLTNCTRLTTLNLRVNALEGDLSSFDFSNFVDLRSVDLGNNLFTGFLPASLFSCKKLKAIRLAANNITGEILPEIMALQSLSFLSISNNSISNITSAIRILTGCKNLTTLILSKNFYDEELPGNENLIGSNGFQNLRVLGLGGCGFIGFVPIWLSKLAKLEVLDLSYNNIAGFIPGWIGDFPSLSYLDFSYNQLSGYFPIDVVRLQSLASNPNSRLIDTSYLELPVFAQPDNSPNLEYNQHSFLPRAIYLGNNQITGTIPTEIGELKYISALDLSTNNFSGAIPETISNLTNLEKLDLSGNHLPSEIPGSLRNLHFLSSFSVGHNNLEGPIPVGGQFDTFPSSSFEGNPGLCGQVVQRTCGHHRDYDERPEGVEREENKETINWVGFEIGFGVSFILTELAVLKFWRRKNNVSR